MNMKIAVGITIIIGLIIGCQTKDKHEGHESQHLTQVYYTCSMDPQVIEKKPGKCPICHMELTPVSLEQLQANGLKLSEEQIRLANIQTKAAAYGYVNAEVFATGLVKENQDRIRFINARMDGRIDRLHIKAKGSAIQKGQILYQIYSEMLAATQSEFIENAKALSKAPNDPLLLSIQQSITNKLLLWALTETQIEQLKLIDHPHIPYPILSPISGIVKAVKATEGSSVMEGQALFEVSEYTSLWVEAQFYPSESKDIRVGDLVEVSGEGIERTIEGKVQQVLPQLSSNSLVSVARILISSQEGTIRPGMQVSVSWVKGGRNSLIVPAKALLRGEQSTHLWVKTKEGIFEPREVHVGEVFGKNAQVLHGIKEGEEVLVSGAYLLQSEYVFRKGNNVMSSHTGHDKEKR